MFRYQTLESTPDEILHKTFIDAFSDYQVKMNLSLEKLQSMLRRRGYVSGISMGAFLETELVGFILNGLRSWNGIPTVYDLGTGVTAEFRKQGISSNLFARIKELLQENGVKQYLLEVINQNTSALELYKKQGFGVVRSFSCFRLDKDRSAAAKTHRVEHVDSFRSMDWERFKGYWDCLPSWQNSIDSVNAVRDSMLFSVAYLDGAIAGYGIVDRKTGDIAQLAVDRQYRGKGIARSIIADFIENTEPQKMFILNVDDEAESVIESLKALSFEFYIGQYEMMLEL